MIDELLKKVLLEYQEENKKPFGASPFFSIITKEIPTLLRDKLGNNDKFNIYGSFGKGGWSDTPWVAILNRNITESTKNGYYIVYLLNTKKNILYLSLAVGWSQFQENFSINEAKEKIQQYSTYFYKHVGKIPQGFINGPVDLDAETPLSKGYEIGQIISKAYSLTEIKDNTLIKDLEELLLTYDELANFVGNDILNISYEQIIKDQNIDNNERAINKITLIQDSENALKALRQLITDQPPGKKEITIMKVVRNTRLARLYKINKKFICEICGLKPFIQKNGEPYAEADHIKPLGGKTNGLDSPENIRCLCAQCHAIITHGSDDEIKKILL